MMKRVPLVAALFFAVPARSHASYNCLINQQISATGTTEILCGGGGGSGSNPPACPNPVPPLPTGRAATEYEVRCKAEQSCEILNPSSCARCGAVPLSVDDCKWMVDQAYPTYVDAGAAAWLRLHLFCPVLQQIRNGGSILADICPAGCFAAATQILTLGSTGAPTYTSAEAMAADTRVLALSNDSTMQAFALEPRGLRRIVHGPEEPDLYVFHLENGRALRLTSHHAVVLADGTVVEAEDVASGASFVDSEGTPVAVVHITREHTDSEVFNLWTESDAVQGHIIVAEGVLVGDLQLQNDIGGETASIELRR